MARLLLILTGAHAFAPAAYSLPARQVRLSAEMTKGGLTKLVRGLTKETFDTIYEQESWIEANAGTTLLSKTLSRVEHKAKAFGLEVKPGFCGNAKATEKARAKREEFYVRKTEEVK